MRLVHEVHGDPSGVPLLLVAGLGLDLTSWPAGIVDGLVAAGFRVVTFDNRDEQQRYAGRVAVDLVDEPHAGTASAERRAGAAAVENRRASSTTGPPRTSFTSSA